MRLLTLFLVLSVPFIGIIVHQNRMNIISWYISRNYNKADEYGSFYRLRNNHTFYFCTTYVYKDSHGFHTWAELDCGFEGVYKTHVFGDRKSEATIRTTKEMGLTNGGKETITGVFPIDTFQNENFGKYNLMANNCRTYLVLLHKVLEAFPHYNKQYNVEPVTELLNVSIGVNYSKLMSEISVQKIKKAIINLW